jgi:hypothetical protein
MTSRTLGEEGRSGGHRSHGIRRGIAQQFRDVPTEARDARGADASSPLETEADFGFDDGDTDRD